METLTQLLAALAPFLVSHVLPVAFTAGVGLLLKFLYHLQSNYAASATHTLGANILNRIESLAILVVSDIEQVERPLIEADAASGKISAEDAAKLKQAAIDKIKTYLSADGIKRILTALGLDSAALDKLIGSFVERAVGNTPNGGNSSDPKVNPKQ